MWILMAVLAAVTAGLMAILAKCGIRKTDPDVATALRTVVVLAFAWLMVAISGSGSTIRELSGRSVLFLILSGLATGASWICCFKALATGNVNKVIPIDKTSGVMAVLAAIVFLGERNRLPVKLLATALFAAGVLLMVEKRADEEKETGRIWLPYAIGSAAFAACSTILAKIGITDVDSDLGTAIRTGVVLVMAWGLVFLQGKQKLIRETDRKELYFILLSGVVTGISWLCYYYAIGHGVVSVVVPIDRMSVVVAVVLSYFLFGEKLSRRALLGLVLIVAGALIMALYT